MFFATLLFLSIWLASAILEANCIAENNFSLVKTIATQSACTFSKLKIETLEQGVKRRH